MSEQKNHSGSELKTKQGAGRGRLYNVQQTLDQLPVASAVMLARAVPSGELLAEWQGQLTLAMARAMARKQRYAKERDGRTVSEATESDGAGAGVLAVARWRAGEDMDGAERGGSGVCWRAVVGEMSKDTFGETVSLSDMSPEGLAGSALPLPGCYEERSDRASRLAFERARAKRPAQLAKRIEAIIGRGGRGRRTESVERIQRAMILLLHGHPLDNAATAAGYHASGTGRHAVKAGDRLAQAVRRLGCHYVFHARQRA
jgi:hypothetical protein